MLKISKSNSFCHLLICSHNLLMFSNFQLISRCSTTTFRNFWLNISCTFVNNGDSHPQNPHNLFCFLSFLPWVFILQIFSPAHFCDFGITFCFLDNFNGLLRWFSFFPLFVSFELFLFKVSDFQSLLNWELTFIPMLYFIRILRTKDNHETTIGNNGQQ